MLPRERNGRRDVIYEASLIGVKDLFDGGIHGAKDALLDCSKEAVIKNMIEEQKLDPEELVTFGDGFVEIFRGTVQASASRFSRR